MTKSIATLVLNRNLGDVTDRLVDHLAKYDHAVADFFVIESGSDADKRSKHASFLADSAEACAEGLRYARGFNFGLSEMLKNAIYDKYEYFFLVCNDSEFTDVPTISILAEEMASHSRFGIVSPCDTSWGEYRMIPKNDTRLFWYGNHIAWLVRRSFIDTIRELETPSFMNFLYDGTNFRGYYSDVELIGKSYVNNFAYALTNKVCFREEANLKDRYSYIIKTDGTAANQEKMFQEGQKWFRRKYGFQSHWDMLRYVKSFYAAFLENNPEYLRYKI